MEMDSIETADRFCLPLAIDREGLNLCKEWNEKKGEPLERKSFFLESPPPRFVTKNMMYFLCTH